MNPSAIHKQSRLTLKSLTRKIALTALLSVGSAHAQTTTQTFNLGPQDAGTSIQAGVGNFIPWITKGTLPEGSIVRSISADIRLDSTTADSWASDLLVYFDSDPDNPATAAVLQIGGDYSGSVGTVGQTIGWTGGDNGPGTTITETKTAGVDWTGDIDLNTVQLSIGNNYATASWSGSITVEYDEFVPAAITSFGPGAVIGELVGNAASIAWTVPSVTDVTSLAPTFTLSSGTCVPVSGSTQDFTNPVVYTVTDGATVNTYTVTVTLANSLQWNVAGGGDWDTSTANWLPLPSGPATTFANGDEVIFDNAAGGTIAVLGMSPSSTTVNNASGEYIFVSEVPTSGGGAPSILSGTLVKDGAGTLQLGAQDIPGPWTNPPYTNGFSSVAINGGRIEYAAHDAFGSAVVTMADGTSLRGVGSAEGRYNFGNEDLPNNFILSGGTVTLPMEFGSNSKDVWLAGDVSGSGGFSITGSHRTLSLSGENTFAGGVNLESTTGSALQIGSYDGLGTGTLTANQVIGGGGLLAGQTLDGAAADKNGNTNPLGVTNLINIVAGKYFNVSGENDSKNLLLSGVISGDGILRKHRNNSTVTLRGTNTYTGGTIIDAGTLKMDVQADSALGTGTVTLNAGTLFLERINATNNLVVNGGKIFGSNGFGNSWGGTVTLNADLTVESTTFGSPTRFDGVISGTGGLILTGQDTVELTAANDYSGDTTVNSGTLKVNGSSIADTNKLIINGGKVEPVGTENVDELYFGTSIQEAGTYGATGSGADNIDDVHFTGTAGVVNAINGVSLSAANILAFGLPGWPAVITGTDIAWTVPVGTDVTNLAPTFVTSFGATATPVSGTSRNFTTPQLYSIESADTTVTQVYTVTVTEGAVPSTFDWAAAVDGNWSEATNWTDDLSIGAGPGTNGATFYTLNFTQAGTYTATHDLSDPFQLNQLNLGANVTLAGNLLAFVSNDTTLPTINQNSGSAVTISNNLDLGSNTAYGGSGSGQVNLTGLISGAGSLTKNGSGKLVISAWNSYSGGTTIENGTLQVNWPGDANPKTSLGSGPVTLNNGTLYLFRVDLANNLIINGGNLVSENGFGNNYTGPITLNATLTCNIQWPMSCSGNISGAGGLAIGGNNTYGKLTLSGISSYAGPTTVTGATLQCNSPDAVAGGDLSISGGMVNLNYVGTKIVASLTLGGVEQTTPGTYGSAASGADIQSDTYFTTGSLGTVTIAGSGSDYDSWLSEFTFAEGADTTPTGDPDGDGATNEEEYAFGLNPTLASSVNPIVSPLDPVTGNFQYTRRATPATTGIGYEVLTSTTLDAWATGGANETGFTTNGNIQTVTVKVTATPVDGKLFVRVKATLP